MTRGQSSVELLLIVATILAVLSAVTVPLFTQSKEKSEELNLISEVRVSGQQIVSLIDHVFASGPNNKRGALVKIPCQISISQTDSDNDLKREMKIAFEGNEIIIETILPSDCPTLSGLGQISPGVYLVTVEYIPGDCGSGNLGEISITWEKVRDV